MAIYKRYKGRRLKRSDCDWDKGTWWIEFSLRGNYVHESIPGVRLKLNERIVNSERRLMNGSTIRAKSFSLNLSMKLSYHGPGRTSGVTARMKCAAFRSKTLR